MTEGKLDYRPDYLEWAPSDVRQKYHDEALQELVHWAYTHSPPMREKLESAGVRPEDIHTTKDLEKLPVTTREDIMAWQKAEPPFGGLLAVPVQELNNIFMVPGPAYSPNFGPPKASAVKRIFGPVFRPGDIVNVTFAHHLGPGGLIWHPVLSALEAVGIPGGTGFTEIQVQMMKDCRVTGYIGTPSFLITLIEKAEELGYDWCRDFSLRAAMVGAEPLPVSLRKRLENYNITVWEIYGFAVGGLMMIECMPGSGQGMHCLDEGVWEIVDPETGRQLGPGERGEVVVTPYVKGYPLIRVGSGDLSYFLEGPCPCGRTSPRIAGWKGRVGEALKVRGMFVHPNQIDEVASKFTQLAAYQAVVTRVGNRDNLTFKIELADQDADREKLTGEIEHSFKDICRVKIDSCDFLSTGTIPEERKSLVDERVWE
jgi:phenylacetate-CoA ligase